MDAVCRGQLLHYHGGCDIPDGAHAGEVPVRRLHREAELCGGSTPVPAERPIRCAAFLPALPQSTEGVHDRGHTAVPGRPCSAPPLPCTEGGALPLLDLSDTTLVPDSMHHLPLELLCNVLGSTRSV